MSSWWRRILRERQPHRLADIDTVPPRRHFIKPSKDREVSQLSIRSDHVARFPVLRALWLTLLLVFSPTANAAPADSPVAVHGQLAVNRDHVVDAHGEPVTLRGMSLFWSQWKPQFYNRRDIDWLRKDWRISAVRVPIAASRGGYDSHPVAQVRLAERVIGAAIAQGIYVVVDWHSYDPALDDAVRFFTTIARKYHGVPNLIYETWNEPLPKYGWKTVIRPYHLRVIAAIRAIDPTSFVVAGTRSWSQDVDEAAADPLPFANVAYTLHFYAATHKQALRDKADMAMKRGIALFATEYGTTAADGDVPIDAIETRRWWRWCEAHGVSYLNWSLSDKQEASAALVPGASPYGHWPARMISTSGTMVRAQIRATNH
jgi:endoglucanase